MNQSPHIHIVKLGQLERSVELHGATTIGRDSHNDIVLDELTVSRCHAVLLMRPEGAILMDLDSTNGTWVNGRMAPPDEAVPLADGDVITLGRIVARYYAAPGNGCESDQRMVEIYTPLGKLRANKEQSNTEQRRGTVP